MELDLHAKTRKQMEWEQMNPAQKKNGSKNTIQGLIDERLDEEDSV